jgi:integrase
VSSGGSNAGWGFASTIRREASRRLRIKTEGFRTCTEADIAAFEAVHSVGTRARPALALLLYTAQRRSDVVRLGRQHVRDGVIQVRQQKMGVVFTIPVHPVLAAILE